MTNWLPVILGLVAGCCTTFGYVPQVLKIWREGDTQAISTRMFVLRVVGLFLWLGYGFALGSLPLIIFNILSLLLASTILVLKVRSSGRSTFDHNRTAALAGAHGDVGRLAPVRGADQRAS